MFNLPQFIGFTYQYTPILTNDPYWSNVSLLLKTRTNWFTRDNSVNNIQLTINGNVRPSVKCPFSGYEGSAFFDGTGDFITIPNGSVILGSSYFTVEAWIYPTTSTGTRVIFSGQSDLNSASGSSFVFYITNGASTSDLYIGGAGYSVTSPNPTINTWSHVAWVRTGNTYSSYLNGTRISTTTATGTVNTGATNYKAAIGGFANSGATFSGYISNFRVIKGSGGYNAANTTITVPTSPLSAITNTLLLTHQSSISTNNNTFLDHSANDFPITKNGNVLQGNISPGVNIGGSAYFDGVGDYLSIPHNANLTMGAGNFTLEFWINIYAKNGITIIDNGGSSGSAYPNYWVNVSASSVDFLVGNSGTPGSQILSLSTTTNPTIGTWYHMALVKNSTTYTVYVNGVSQATTTNATVPSKTTTNPLVIGMAGGATTYFSGMLSNIRMSNIARYTANFTTPSASFDNDGNTLLLLRCENFPIYDAVRANNIETTGNSTVSIGATQFTQPTIFMDGSGDYLTFPSNSLLNMGSNNFTIDGWLKNSASGTYVIFDTRGSDIVTSYLLLQNSSNKLVFYADAANAGTSGSTWDVTLTSTTSINSGVWVYFAVVRNGTSWVLYINGVSESTATSSITIGTLYSSVLIGSGFNSSTVGAIGYNYPGYLYDFRITKGIARSITTPTEPFFTY